LCDSKSLQRDRSELRPGADLLENGYVDSAEVVEVVGFLQAEYGVEIPDSDLMSDDIATVDGLARLVSRLFEGANVAGGERKVPRRGTSRG